MAYSNSSTACRLPPNTNNEIYLGLTRDVEVTGSPCSTLQSDLLLLLTQVLLYIWLRAFEDDFSLSFWRLKNYLVHVCLFCYIWKWIWRKRISPERWLIERQHSRAESTASHSSNVSYASYWREKVRVRVNLECPHFTSCCCGDETFLPGLLILFTFLEESLRDFNCLVQHARSG